MVVLNRIYTRKGDDGTTRLTDGALRHKSDLRIEAYGTVDEPTPASAGPNSTPARTRPMSMPCSRGSRTTCSISALICPRPMRQK